MGMFDVYVTCDTLGHAHPSTLHYDDILIPGLHLTGDQSYICLFLSGVNAKCQASVLFEPKPSYWSSLQDSLIRFDRRVKWYMTEGQGARDENS